MRDQEYHHASLSARKKGAEYASPEEVFGADALTIVEIQFEEVTNHYEQ